MSRGYKKYLRPNSDAFKLQSESERAADVATNKLLAELRGRGRKKPLGSSGKKPKEHKVKPIKRQPSLDNLDAGQREFIENKVRELGLEEALRYYSGDSIVHQYARFHVKILENLD